MRFLTCLLLLSLSPQDGGTDRYHELRMAAESRPVKRAGGSSAVYSTWLDHVRAYGASRGVDVLNDPDAIARLLP